MTRFVPIAPRQADVLRELLRDGASNRVIGRRLYLTEDTVKTHMRRIYDATGCRGRVALLNALRTGRIVLDPDITQED